MPSRALISPSLKRRHSISWWLVNNQQSMVVEGRIFSSDLFLFLLTNPFSMVYVGRYRCKVHRHKSPLHRLTCNECFGSSICLRQVLSLSKEINRSPKKEKYGKK